MPRSTFFVAGVCTCLMCRPSSAQSPAHLVDSKGSDRPVQPGSPPPPPRPAGDEIYNTLYITEQQAYISGNGDAWSGRGVWGDLYDLQVVDDVVFEGDCCIRELVRDYVTFFGAAPAGGAYVALYAMNSDRRPEEQAAFESDGVPFAVESFSDTVFGLVGVRGTAAVGGSMCAPAARWFVETQPHDETDAGDWYYALHDGQCRDWDMYFRDGGRGLPGYGFYHWMGIGDFGFGCGTQAMAVRAECVLPRAVCIYEIASVRRKAELCGLPCGYCPYGEGGLICAEECPGGETDCANRLRGFAVCEGGGACEVRAALVGCEVPPLYCASCE